MDEGNIKQAVDLLSSRKITVIDYNENKIFGDIAPEMQQLNFGELVSFTEPFTIKKNDNIWIASFIVGQVSVIVKVSDNLTTAVEAVCSYYSMREERVEFSGRDLSKRITYGLLLIQMQKFVAEIHSASELHVYPMKTGSVININIEEPSELMRNADKLINRNMLFIVQLETNKWVISYRSNVDPEALYIADAQTFDEIVNVIKRTYAEKKLQQGE